jgi:hypothetical protein
VSISKTSSSSETETDLLTHFIQVMQEISFHIIDQGSDWEFHDTILSISTIHTFGSATFSVFCSDFFDIAEITERIDIGISDSDEITSASSITSKWSSLRNTRLMTP